MLGAVLVGCSTRLYAEDASTQTEPAARAKKSTVMQTVKGVCGKSAKAVAHGAQFLYRRRNTKPARIGGHALKIAGSVWAIVGSYQTMDSLKKNHVHTLAMYKNHIDTKEYTGDTAETDKAADMASYHAAQGYFSSRMNPQRLEYTLATTETRATCKLTPISRPPYEAIFALSAYLIYDGCRGIYNELKTWKKKNDTARS